VEEKVAVEGMEGVERVGVAEVAEGEVAVLAVGEKVKEVVDLTSRNYSVDCSKREVEEVAEKEREAEVVAAAADGVVEVEGEVVAIQVVEDQVEAVMDLHKAITVHLPVATGLQ